MAHIPELEKLERRYTDDPAKWFAQMADAYRKYQRVDEALDILNMHLQDRPNYVSALIVLGRCHLDKQADAEAHAAFERVLAIDPENIIALKVLGEVAERGGDLDAARTWLGRLLEVDPANDEARESLDRLGGPAVAAEPEAAPAPAPAPEANWSDLAEEVEAPPPAEVMGLEPTSMEELTIERASPEPAMPTVEMEPIRLETTPAPALEPAPEPVESVEGLMEVEPPAEEVAPVAGFEPLELAEPEADGPAPELAPDLELEPEPESEPEPRGSLAGLPVFLPPEEETAAPAAPAPMALDDEQVPGAEPEPVVTETMAELYVQQGLLDAARDVYRRLLLARPGDARLEERLRALSQAEAPAPPNRFAAAETGGASARTFLQAILERRYQGAAPPAAPAPAAPVFEPAPSMDEAFAEEPLEPKGQPTRQASSAFSLGEVFGEAESSPAPPATSPPPPEGKGGKGGEGGFSFDEFFGGERPAAPPSAPGGGEDEDSFRDWLKGLKK